MPEFLRRLVAALPDAATAAFFVSAWRDPLGFGPNLVGDLLVVMLLEFLLVHSGAFIGNLVLAPNVSRTKKTLGVVGFGAFYMLFVLGFAYGMGRPWAIWAFLWLLGARVVMIWFAPVARDDEARRQQIIWASSAAAYILGVFVTILVPIPRWGLTPDVVAQIGVANTGSGLWQQHPQTVLAFGALYFAVVACLRWSFAIAKTTTAPASPPVPSSKWPWKPGTGRRLP